jgi:O-antigen/teichoic acid export membrane protein
MARLVSGDTVFKNRLSANIAYMLMWQAGNYLVPLLTFPFLTRTLGVRGFGEFSLAFAIVAYISLVTDWGFALGATGEVARHREDHARITKIFWDVLTAKMLLVTLCLVVLGIATLTIASARVMAPALFSASLGVVAAALTTNWCLQGLERLGSFALAATLGKMLTVPAILLLVHAPDDAWLAILIQSLGSGVAAIASIVLLRRLRVIGRISVSLAGAVDQLRKGWHLFLSSAAVNIYTSTNAVVIGVVAGASGIAIYAAADRLRTAAQCVVSPISQAIYPHSNRLIAEDRGAGLAFGRKLLLVQGGVTAIISLSLLIGAPILIPLLAGPNFSSSIIVLQIMSPLPFLIGVSNVLGIQMMLPMQMQPQFSGILTRAAILNVAFVLPLTWFFAAKGTASGSVLAEMYVTGAMVAALRAQGFNVFAAKVRYGI